MLERPYDLILTLGDDCACSWYLRAFGLQNASYPFDWIGWAPIDRVVDLIVGDFEGFLDVSRFEPAVYPNPEATDEAHDFYKNTRTGLFFAHDFPAGVPPRESLPEVEAKYGRRIRRFFEEIRRAKHVLFVWMSKTSCLDDGTLVRERARLAGKFPGIRIDWLILENDSAMKPLEFRETEISPNILRIVFDNVSYDTSDPSAEWRGNRRNIDAVFSRLHLKTPYGGRLKKALYKPLKALCGLIPVRKYRRKIREALKHRLIGD